MSAKYELFRSPKNNQYYFRLKAPNGEVILSSEGYVQKSGAQNGIASCQQHSPFDRFYTKSDKPLYFTLRAANYQVIGVSEVYTTAYARDNGIEPVKKNGPTTVIVDLT
ncbi:hypothetical protein D3C81_1504080 [compost metagenome]